MMRLLILGLLSLVGLAAAIGMVARGREPGPRSTPVLPPITPAYAAFVSGAGVVEAGGGDISVGAPSAGIIATLSVAVGSRVQKGAPLFTLDSRVLEAQLRLQAASVRAARARLDRLRQQPRAEELPPAQARLGQARSDAADADEHLRKLESVVAGAVTRDEIDHERRIAESAHARMAEAEANVAMLRAGAWAPDLAVAEADLAVAAAQEESTRTAVDLLTVRAPSDGEVLQLNIHQGEFVGPGSGSSAPLILGPVDELQLRVDVDEIDAWRIDPTRRAEAYLRGNHDLKAQLRFVRIEPCVVPKASLSGMPGERVDTRVLQVIYAVAPSDLPIFVGQQLDVVIDVDPPQPRQRSESALARTASVASGSPGEGDAAAGVR